MSKVKRAVLISALGENSLQLINFVTIAILARLLSPEEIGLFAVAMAIAFVAAEIRSFGVGEFLIREEQVTTQKIRNVLGVMIIMSWGIGALIIAAAPSISQFYASQDLVAVLCIITVPFFLAPHSAVPVALISRDMQFGVVFKIHLIGCIGGNILKVLLVYQGYSYYGLAWGTLLGVVLEFLAITYYRPKGMPWLPSFSGIGQVFKVGSRIGLAKFLATLSGNTVDLVLGKAMNLHSVGMFSRGIGLILFIQSILVKAITPVALPHFSEINRSQPSLLKQAYLDSIKLASVVTIPVFAVLSLCASELIIALFGDQWVEAGSLASILTLWAIISSVHCFSSALLVTLSQESYFLRKEILSLLVKFLFIVLAIPYGLNAVAWSFVLSGLVEFLIITVMLRRLIDLSIHDIFSCIRSNVFIGVVCWLVLYAMYEVNIVGDQNAFKTIAIIAVVMTPLWLLLLKLTRHPLMDHLSVDFGAIFNRGRTA